MGTPPWLCDKKTEIAAKVINKCRVCLRNPSCCAGNRDMGAEGQAEGCPLCSRLGRSSGDAQGWELLSPWPGSARGCLCCSPPRTSGLAPNWAHLKGKGALGMLWAGCEGLQAEHRNSRAAEGLGAWPQAAQLQPQLRNGSKMPQRIRIKPFWDEYFGKGPGRIIFPWELRSALSPHGNNRAAALSQSLAAGLEQLIRLVN